ncbi:hypothetical protein [Thermanaeromonas toyohensis]|uniref:hypothetical protein n=1 Tax=Thermanaeromonas toyohensis TaxID=161154 RepID=UPI001E639605|nr:hypothetical protein [Thermanaeromonas toyohensis]
MTGTGANVNGRCRLGANIAVAVCVGLHRQGRQPRLCCPYLACRGTWGVPGWKGLAGTAAVSTEAEVCRVGNVGRMIVALGFVLWNGVALASIVRFLNLF